MLYHTTYATPCNLIVPEESPGVHQRVVSTYENMNSNGQSMGISLVCLEICLEILVKKLLYCQGVNDSDNSLINHVYAPDPRHTFSIYHLIHCQQSYQ